VSIKSSGEPHITATIWPCICLSRALVLSDNDTTELVDQKNLAILIILRVVVRIGPLLESRPRRCMSRHPEGKKIVLISLTKSCKSFPS